MRPMVEKVQRELDESEKQELETQVTNDWRALREAEEAKKEEMKSHNDTIAAIKKRLDVNSLAVKTGSLAEDKEVFVEFDHEEGKAYIYLNEGDTEPASERLMTPKEMKEPMEIPM